MKNILRRLRPRRAKPDVRVQERVAEIADALGASEQAIWVWVLGYLNAVERDLDGESVSDADANPHRGPS